MAVNKTISDEFILKRLKDSGRVIYKSSSDYFYEILPVGLKFICENDSKNNCFIWNAFDLNPVYFGKISAQPTVEHPSTAGWGGKILLFAALCAMMLLKYGKMNCSLANIAAPLASPLGRGAPVCKLGRRGCGW